MSWRDLTPKMQKALARLSHASDCAAGLGVPYTTLAALERRRLIRVETSFNAIAFPSKAEAHITDAGREVLARKSR